jgi:transposase InsO family protein
VVAIMVGTPTGADTARFVAHLVRHWRRHGYRLRAVITDNGAEYIAGEFRQALAARDIRHVPRAALRRHFSGRRAAGY